MYLTRLRRGDRYNRIYEAFNVGQKAGRQYIAKCRIALETDFVPRNIGLNAISREELLQSITNMANGLFLNNKKDRAVVIADGTYIFCQKTQNFTMQKELYSTYKKRHLFKPMVLVTTNGRFLDVFGPYSARINDADILKSMFNTYASQINGKLSKDRFNVCFSTVANGEKRFILIRYKCSNKMLFYSFIFLNKYQKQTEQIRRRNYF